MRVIHCQKYEPIENDTSIRRNIKNAVALGNFDGLHLGHAKLIEEMTKRTDTDSYVYTFEIHPSKFMSHDPSLVRSLITNEQKVEILTQMGVKFVCFDDFQRVRNMSPSEFVKDVLIDTLKCDVAICGYNFSFGKKGAGTSELLKTELAKYGAECIIVPPVTHNQVTISSTRIRNLIENGDAEEAARLLGRPFSIRRPVIHGRMLGRTLGIPTVNQSFGDDCIIPASGVYVCRLKVDGKDFPAVCDVGTKPTVNGSELLSETHIIGYDGDLYGKTVEVAFLKRLRAEQKFSDIDELKSVIQNDIASAKKYFGIL